MTRTWFEVDARALGVFRVALGATLLLDLSRRIPDLDLFWGGREGVFPPPPEGTLPSFSLLSGSHPPALAWALLAVSLLAAALFTLGRWPRVAGLVTLAGLTSFHANRFGLETGASQVLRLALIYAILLPTDVCYVWRGGPSPRESSTPTPAPVRSIAVLALLLQLGLIYFNAAAARAGPSWLSGTAIHDMLELDTYVTPLGAWLRGPAVDAASPALTEATLVLEVMGPLLMLVPVAPDLLRGVTLVALFGFHLCILLLLDVGLFSPAMFCLLLFFVPGRVFDALGRRRARPVSTPPPVRWQRWPFEAVALLLLVANVWLGAHRNLVFGPELRAAGLGVPAALDIALSRLEISQTWRMFAPNVSRIDQVALVPATTASGRTIDLLTGAPPDFGPVGRDRPRGQFWTKYFERLAEGAASPEALRRRLVERWNRANPDPIVRAEVVLLREHTLDLGQTTLEPPQRTVLLGADAATAP